MPRANRTDVNWNYLRPGGTLDGRWEYTDNEGSDKFWQCSYELTTGTYLTEWGKNGAPPNAQKPGLSYEDCIKKIREKERKDYQLVGPCPRTVANAAAHATSHREHVTTAAAKAKEPAVGKRRIIL
jgi:hypothetical protein